jgi:ubiquinone/menaquinone biosynthesis C-methylase UbiE
VTNRQDEPGRARDEWRGTNTPAYEALWRTQRAALGGARRTGFSELFELQWEISNQYWAAFLNRRAPGRRLLECGGATGRLPAGLAKEGWHCALLDITEEGPLLARARFEAQSVPGWFVRGDVFVLPFGDETFDVVYSNGLLDVLPDIRPAIREMTRVLRPGGLFVAACNPRRLSVQTVAEWLLAGVRRIRRRDPTRALPATGQPVFRNDFSLAAHLAACREAGLEDARGHGVGLLPIVPLPGPLMRSYVWFTRALAPLCVRFNSSEGAWTAKWGVMLAIYGSKPTRDGNRYE